MGAKKYPDRLRARTKLSADGTGYVRTKRLGRGKVLTCQSIAFRNQTGARGNVEVYLKQAAALTFIFDQVSPAANIWYWYPYTQNIKEGEQIEAQQASCSSGDILDIQVIGLVTYTKDGGID